MSEINYYNQPMLKRPVWIWSVPVYFYVGGVSGAALVLAAAAQTVDRDQFDGLIKKCRWLGATGHALSAYLLIIDLGRPSRFLNMLRTLNLKSPLSVGSWVLTLGGALSGASVVFKGRAADTAGLAAGILGVPLAGYTGVLLSGTAIPVWQKSRRLLPLLSMASGVAGLASLFEMAKLSEVEETAVRRFGLVGMTAELAVMTVMEPPPSGLPGALFKAAGVLTVASLSLALLAKNSNLKRAAGLAGTAGAIALRFAVFYSGFTAEERSARISRSESQSPSSHY